MAIKVLPHGLANDAERIARFEREARLLASLNHPHIAQIYGFEESAGTRFLVLELVEGQTLAERLRQGVLSVEDGLFLAKQLAEGLEYAHDRGVLHRDLKPANIKLTPEGKLKILDFGLAKALASDESVANLADSPTISEAVTRAAIMLGTPAYMSPEQARGKPLDKRTDIWSFGCVLYEILTGRQAFPGEAVTDCLAEILRGEPDWSSLPANTPPQIKSLLRRCLQKDPARRLRDIGDARIEIEEALAAPVGVPAGILQGRLSRRQKVGLGVILLLAVALGSFLQRIVPQSHPRSFRFSVVTNFSGVEAQPSFSPDGRSVAFVSNRDGQWDIYVGW